jgi:hypothetical protein
MAIKKIDAGTFNRLLTNFGTISPPNIKREVKSEEGAIAPVTVPYNLRQQPTHRKKTGAI